MHRRSKWIAPIAGLGLASLLGSGVFAFVSARATSGDNRVTSNGLTARVLAAEIPLAQTTCDDVELHDDPLPVLVDEAIQLNGDGRRSRAKICVRNESDFPGQLQLGVFDPISTEVFDCRAQERQAGDTSCDAEGEGELDEVLDAQVLACDGTADRRPFPTTQYTYFAAGDLAARSTCIIEFETYLQDDLTVDDRFLAASDRLQFDLYFLLRLS